jgi:hypothetical protein
MERVVECGEKALQILCLIVGWFVDQEERSNTCLTENIP